MIIFLKIVSFIDIFSDHNSLKRNDDLDEQYYWKGRLSEASSLRQVYSNCGCSQIGCYFPTVVVVGYVAITYTNIYF